MTDEQQEEFSKFLDDIPEESEDYEYYSFDNTLNYFSGNGDGGFVPDMIEKKKLKSIGIDSDKIYFGY